MDLSPFTGDKWGYFGTGQDRESIQRLIAAEVRNEEGIEPCGGGRADIRGVRAGVGQDASTGANGREQTTEQATEH